MNNELNNKYIPAPLSLLTDGIARDVEIEDKSKRIEETLNQFEINATVVDFKVGPTFTEYLIKISKGIPRKVFSLQDDICFALGIESGSIRIEAIPHENLIGIEVPNKKRSTVYLKELLTEEFMTSSSLNVALGKDVSGNPIYCDIAKMPHLLMAGTTASGKSVCINSMLMSILCKASPEEVKFLMIDPKVVELNTYNGIPHLLTPVINDPQKAILSLGWANNEMERRYKLFAEQSVRDIKRYNEWANSTSNKTLPRIVIVVEELSDLMTTNAGAIEEYISRLAAMSRAAGIHMIIATQRPSVDVITGVIKANTPSRIAFHTSSGLDSRTVIDSIGAEKLLGMGDMLYWPAFAPKPIRTQCAYVSDAEIDGVTAYLRENYKVNYNDEILSFNEGINSTNHDDIGYKDDPIFLLSIEEYELYKDTFSNSGWWWLRSTGNIQSSVVDVYYDGSIHHYGHYVDSDKLAVRPALKYSNLKSELLKSSLCDDRFIFNDFPFRIIDEEKEIAIAEVPIAINIFDRKHNNYEKSEIRRKLLSWFKFGIWD